MKLFSRAFSLLLLFSVSVFGQDVKTEQITLRGTFGPAFFSGNDPVSSGLSLGVDIAMDLNQSFGIATVFSHTFGSGYDNNLKTDFDQKMTFFGLNPYFQLKKGVVMASMGPVIGVRLQNDTVRVAAANGPVYTSSSKLTFGLRANVEIPIAGPMSFVATPEYLHSLGGGQNPGQIMIRGGFSVGL